MVSTNFEGYRTLGDEGQAPLKAYDCVFARDFQASIRIATYGMSVPSLHRVYRLCDWGERERVPHRRVALDVVVDTSTLECN